MTFANNISDLTIYNNMYFTYREDELLNHHHMKFKTYIIFFILITICSNLVAGVVTINKIMLDEMTTLP